MKKFWKVCKYLAIIIFSILLADVIIVIFFSIYRPPVKKADAIVVLGAAINTKEIYYRSLQGLKLYQAGDAPVIVLSGGQDFPKAPTEAEYMEKVINANSTTSVALILENQSHSTYDNIKNTKNIIGPDKSIIIVSDGYHLARAVVMAEREGFKVVYWSSPNPSYYKPSELAFYYGREFLAMISYIPKFIFG
jgi:uncharacterized SAM-binding protein YcdF (DUF218 family)